MLHRVLLIALTGCWASSTPTKPPTTPPPEQTAPDQVPPRSPPEIIEDDSPGGDPCAVTGGVQGGTVGGVVGGNPPLPPPPPLAHPVVSPAQLEAIRIAGTRAIVPSDATKLQIARAGRDKLLGSWKLCLDTTGAIATVTQLRSTGFPDYDRAIEHEIRTGWRYQPYLINGVAAMVCTGVTFVYTQDAPQAPPRP